jgi:phage repressor protein C with HTH and peptisase S24 domain
MSTNELNERFRVVYEELQKRGAIVKSNPEKSKSMFAFNIFGNKSYGFLIDKCLRNERKISFKHAQKLSDYYQVRLDFMTKGELPIFQDEVQHTAGRMTDSEVRYIETGRSNILFSTAAAFASNTFGMSNNEEYTENFSIPGIHGEHVAFVIDGNSMYPTITNSDMVICRFLNTGERIIDNQIYVIRTFDNNLLVKRVQQIVGQNNETIELKLISDNYIEHDPFFIPIEEVRDLLKVVHKVTPL